MQSLCMHVPFQEYYSNLFGTPMFDNFMRGGIIAWEYAESHLEYWRKAGIPQTHYVRVARTWKPP
jgi:hypothetical protein